MYMIKPKLKKLAREKTHQDEATHLGAAFRDKALAYTAASSADQAAHTAYQEEVQHQKQEVQHSLLGAEHREPDIRVPERIGVEIGRDKAEQGGRMAELIEVEWKLKLDLRN